jgi:hypothetical protein
LNQFEPDGLNHGLNLMGLNRFEPDGSNWKKCIDSSSLFFLLTQYYPFSGSWSHNKFTLTS